MSTTNSSATSPSSSLLLLSGKVALVTGASRGIGAAIARALAEHGARVVITHRDSAEGAAQVLADLSSLGSSGSGSPQHRVLQVDATDTAGLERAAASVASVEGRLDILVNNAGYTKFFAAQDDPLDVLDDELFDRILATNVRGPFCTIRAFRKLLKSSSSSSSNSNSVVVNISSVAAVIARGSNPAYCASKAALDNITKNLARTLAPEGIRVMCVSPGLIDTDLTAHVDPGVKRAQIEQTPLGRLATTSDVARTVLGVVAWMPATTGNVVLVDGGRNIW